MAVGVPDSDRGQGGFVGLELVHHGSDHVVGDFSPSMWLIVEDLQGVDLILVLFEVFGKFLDQFPGVLDGILTPAFIDDLVQIVVVDLLFLVSSDAVDQLYQVAIENMGCRFDQFRLSFFTLFIARIGAHQLSRQLQGFGFDSVGVDGVKQAIDQMRQFNAFCRLPDSGLFIGIELLVQARQSSGQRADGIGIAGPHHHAHCQVF